MLKILQVTEDFSIGNTGVTASLYELTRYLQSAGHHVEIFASGTDSIAAPEGSSLHQFPLSLPLGVWRLSRGLVTSLEAYIRSSDVMHIHGVWMHTQWAAMRAGLRCNHRFIVTPHNMLGGPLWRRGLIRKIKKRLYWQAMIGGLVTKATVVHALSPLEYDTLRRELLPSTRIEVIPNAIDTAAIKELGFEQSFAESDERYLLFLGRLHPVKGLERLFHAYAPISSSAKLIVAGPCHSDTYLSQLHALVRQLRIENQVTFVGPVIGNAKWRLIRNAWAVCAPSLSEGLSMVNLEAMSTQTPVITSKAAAIQRWKEAGCLVFDAEVSDLRSAIEQVLAWTISERRARGEAARKIVKEFYDWSVVGPQYVEFYRSVAS